MRALLIAVAAVAALAVLGLGALLLTSRSPGPGGAGGAGGSGSVPGADGADASGGGIGGAGGSADGMGGAAGAGTGASGGAGAAGSGSPGAAGADGTEPAAKKPVVVDPVDMHVPAAPGVVVGEIPPGPMSPADVEKFEEARRKVAEADLGRVAWRRRPLSAVADDLAKACGLEVELDGEGLGDEPVSMEGDGVKVRQVLDLVSASRALRYEIRPGKVVIRR